ncbi:energy transducer TonB [Tenacibaculum finnmarkense]|uniref:Energy transducer TonB n=1 Tax=Tenacibaculum finnmarkense genomovar ulcerans TaxID=2781388 RepID=A0A2I2LF45_9FLAO|nr:energy transducer TonB [Tenacibaculum finnmarkense]MBE7645337.1 energy transducer TonB [Tenacibaculum finnmarkense genomovar ulcerans]MBE7647475.1 energy transducer TonB [Tenacibaculum finnmarkense genomovar ulcerans]MBE7687256.1 energy transducer TonB [Tenacibaculum finnmarkense genomovar ulcerans]MBE7696814.1 energy transducer TonB [Tenacibaculum finnmarkense genomovar ulcerans]MCD8401010.1 energy transducer TonB [Tenacibaculum finnmarkense genomovar ulcerans]
MEIKKNPKSNLENYSKLFMQLGLVLALFVTYVAIENKTYDKTYGVLEGVEMASEIEEETIELTIEPPKPKQNTPPPPAPDKIEVVEDEKEVEETVIESTETDESEAVEVEDIEEVEEEEEVVEDVPFSIIEEVPIFPGCTGSKTEKKACLNKKLQKHVQRNFDAELANELGLAPGKKRIYVQFKIDKDGSITSVNARAPHPRLKKEAIRVAKKIPKMKPGRQRGRAVRVGYTLPITFNVE